VCVCLAHVIGTCTQLTFKADVPMYVVQVVQTGRIKVYSVQVDNQLLTSSHPVILAQTATGLHEKAVEGDVQPGHPAGHVHHRRPFLDLSWEMLHHNSSIVYFRSVGLAIAPLDLVLEEDFLDRIVHVLRSAPVGDIWQAETPSGQRAGSSPADGLAEALQVPCSCAPHCGNCIELLA
jgi:hypothetical protein